MLPWGASNKIETKIPVAVVTAMTTVVKAVKQQMMMLRTMMMLHLMVMDGHAVSVDT